MDANTTVAVDILIRTSLGNAGAAFDRELARMESSARAWAKRMNDIFAKVNTNFRPPATTGGSPGAGGRGTGGGGGGDPAMAAAMRDINRMQNERRRMETAFTQHVNREAEKQYRAQASRIQREAELNTKTFQRTLQQNQQAMVAAGRSAGGITAGGIWSASFWGNIAGNIVGQFTAKIMQLPSILKGILDEAIDLAKRREAALAGLASVSSAKGLDSKSTREAVLNLRLVKAGIVDIGDATTAMKNLLATNFNLAEATKLLEAFSDTAAFGKQNALSFGEAIRGASEGIKNGNSILVDNVGLTKNLSIILKEMGFSETDLMRVQSDLNVRTALFNGLIREASINIGDADRLTKTYTGSSAALDMAQKNLLATIGDIIITNKALLAVMNTLTQDIDKQTAAIKGADATWRDSINSMTNAFAGFVLSVRTGIRQEIADLEELLNYIKIVALAIPALDDKISPWTGGEALKQYNDAINKIGTFSRSAEVDRLSLTNQYNRNLVLQMGLNPGYNPLTSSYRAPLGSSIGRPKMSDLMDFTKPPPGAGQGMGTADTTGLKKKNKKAEIDELTRDLQPAIDLLKGLNFTQVTSGSERVGFKRKGVDHANRGALDFSIRDSRGNLRMAEAEYARQQLLDLGYYVPPLKHGTAPHLHVGVPKGGLSSGKRQMDARQGFDRYAAQTVFPVSAESLARTLSTTRSGGFRQGDVATDGSGVSDQLLTRTGAYVANLRESLGLNTRAEQLAIRQIAAQDEINARVEDYVMMLNEAVTQNQVDLGVAKARLPLIEAAREFEASRTAQLNETKDIERDLAVLRLQNADAVYAAQRALNASKAEQLDLERDISQSQDLLQYQGVNDQLKIRAALLRDIYELRERETDAIIAQNRAQLEITQQTQYSANQANAKVLEFMASQKGVTDIMADFRIGLVESGYDLIDRGLDRIIPKIGILGDTIKDLVSSFLKLAVNAAFRRLFGLDAGNASGGASGARGGGGIAGFFGNLFGGGGGGAGGGGLFGGGVTTPPFNPNAGSGVGGGTGGGGLLSNIIRRITGGGASGGVSGADLGIGGIPGAAGGQVLSPSGLPLMLPGARPGGGAGGMSAALQGQLMGALTGGALGASLGQGDPLGSILGGAGGVIGGTLASGLISGAFTGSTGGGIFGATPGLFGLSGAATFGIGLAVAGAVSLIGYLFGRAARRRKEKREVTTLSGDALTKVQQLITDVNSFRLDGATAYQQGVAIRDDYQEQIKALKTKPGKRLAQQKLGEINRMLADLKAAGDRTDRLKSIATATDEALVPTFASGGFTGLSRGLRLIGVHGNEAVLNQQNIMALGGYRALQNAGVKGMGMNDTYERSYAHKASAPGAGGSAAQPIYIVGVFDDSTADEMFDRVSHYGVAKKVRFAAKKNLAGMVDQIENTMAGE